MKNAKKKALIAAGTLGALVVGYNMNTTYVKPWELGVINVKSSPLGILGATGIQHGDYRGGLKGGETYFTPFWFTQMLTIDGSIQTINYNRFYDAEKAKDSKWTIEMPMQRIQTTDQYQVDTDISVTLQVEDAWKVVNKSGAGELYKTNASMLSTVPAALRKTLSMRPEDFFQLDETTGEVKRVAAEKKAVAALDEVLDEFGLGADKVLIRYPEFAPEMQAKFEAKSVQTQLFFTNEAEARLAEKNTELSKIRTEGEQAAEVRRREGEGYQRTKAGETDAYKRTRESDGDRIENMAQAEATRLVNESYQGAGSDKLVALEMVRNLKMDQILVPVCGDKGFNPLNIDQTIDSLGGKN